MKFPNNMQGSRVLANELLCASLATILSLPVALGAVVLVEEALVRYSDEMYMELERGRVRCQHGPCFGSRFPVDPRLEVVYEFLPSSLLRQVSNLREICGMFVFDVWTSNVDNRQLLFVNDKPHSYRAVMIDQSLCFSGAAWQFSDRPQQGAYLDRRVYEGVCRDSMTEPWLTLP